MLEWGRVCDGTVPGGYSAHHQPGRREPFQQSVRGRVGHVHSARARRAACGERAPERGGVDPFSGEFP
jgi:hypothetical protein